MGYKDRIWCTLYSTGLCRNDNCYRAFPSIDREQAIKWWGGDDFPITLLDMKTEECGYIKNSIVETLEYAVSDKETKYEI